MPTAAVKQGHILGSDYNEFVSTIAGVQASDPSTSFVRPDYTCDSIYYSGDVLIPAKGNYVWG